MTSTLSKWLTIGFIVFSIAGWAIAIIFIGKANKADQTNQNNATTIKAATKIVQKMAVDTFGKTHTKVETQAPLNSTQLKNEKLPGWADTAAKGLDNGAQYKEQLEAQTQINISLRDSLLKAHSTTNELKQQVFFYKNKFINLQYTMANGKDTTDHGTFSYHYNANLITSEFYKKNWFLGPRHYFLDFSTDDKNMTINNVQHYQVEEPEQLFGFYARVGLRYNFIDNIFSPAFGARFDFSKFSLEGNGYFNPNPLANQKKISYSISGFYNFLKL